MKIPVLFLTLAILTGAVSCAFHQTNADNSSPAASRETNTAAPDKPTSETAKNTDNANGGGGKNTKALSAQSIAGNYKFETNAAGKEGYRNSLEVEVKGDGKLSVYFSAAYIYKANGAETFKEASGGGKGALRGNTLTVSLVEDGGGQENACKATIIFSENQAAVKLADDCGFNVRIDGVYKKEKPQRKAKNREEEYVSHVEFNRLAEYINDIDKQSVGEEFVAEAVPMIQKVERADENGDPAFRGLFWLSADGESNVATSFYAASDFVKALRPHLKTAADHLRVECVIVEVSGAGEVYRTPYATAIEAVDAGGKILWRVEGAKPRRVRIEY